METIQQDKESRSAGAIRRLVMGNRTEMSMPSVVMVEIESVGGQKDGE